MIIRQIEFITSSINLDHCPLPNKPEFAFIGRSNVGKSSLINMLIERKNLAKTSSTPGKTQTINHYLINEQWFLADLPGYGYAAVSRHRRHKWENLIKNYILSRNNVYCFFILIDFRIKPQEKDLHFIHWLGENEIPLALIFTKIDQVKKRAQEEHKKRYIKLLQQRWEPLPPIFLTSAVTKSGRDKLIAFLEYSLSQKNRS